MEDFLNSLANMMDTARQGTQEQQERQKIREGLQGLTPAEIADELGKVRALLEEKEKSLLALREKLRAMPTREMLGDAGAALKDQVSDLMEEISTLHLKEAVFSQPAPSDHP